MSKRLSTRCCWGGISLMLSSTGAWATGFDLPDQDAFALGRGMAFAATADNPSAIYYNPAGITQLPGHNLRAGVYALYMQPSFSSSAGTFHNEKDLHAVPQLYYTYGPESLPLSFGLGLYAPFGLSSRWAQNTGFRTVATEGSLSYYTINPVVAWQVVTNLSIAAGLTVNYADTDLKQGVVWPTQSFDQFRFKGSGWDVGYNFGLLCKPLEKVSIGITFRSPTTFNLEGHTDAHNDVLLPSPPSPFPVPPFRHRSDAEASFPFPLKAIFGISYRPTPDWNFEFNADYNDWSRLGTVTLKQETPLPPLLPKNIAMQFDWQPSWYYEFGATRYLGQGWSVSAGYIFNENSVPTAHYNPLVFDQDRHFFSAGVGHKGKHLSFDIGYQFGYGPSRTVSGSAPSALGQTADGRYKFLSHALATSVGWHF